MDLAAEREGSRAALRLRRLSGPRGRHPGGSRRSEGRRGDRRVRRGHRRAALAAGRRRGRLPGAGGRDDRRPRASGRGRRREALRRRSRERAAARRARARRPAAPDGEREPRARAGGGGAAVPEAPAGHVHDAAAHGRRRRARARRDAVDGARAAPDVRRARVPRRLPVRHERPDDAHLRGRGDGRAALALARAGRRLPAAGGRRPRDADEGEHAARGAGQPRRLDRARAASTCSATSSGRRSASPTAPSSRAGRRRSPASIGARAKPRRRPPGRRLPRRLRHASRASWPGSGRPPTRRRR